MQFISNGIERMRLTGEGIFGIGTTTPMQPLHVDGDIRFVNLPTGTQNTAIMLDANGDLSTRTLSIANWDIAYAWGNHATAGYLTVEIDPVWVSDSIYYYTKSMLQNSGQSQVHYDNLTNVPDVLWDNINGTPDSISYFTNDAGYITSPDDADHDPTNELQHLNINEYSLFLENGGGWVPLSMLNYWSKNDDDLYYTDGKVGIGISPPTSELHIHSNEGLPGKAFLLYHLLFQQFQHVCQVRFTYCVKTMEGIEDKQV
ncbi:MAG: hypothetical protein U9Q98_01135 [Bacteroidota bacterium]|nr:hypothetical protein [Bacteroidota bacterium]